MHVLRCHCSKGEAEALHAMSGYSVHACDMTYAAGMLITISPQSRWDTCKQQYCLLQPLVLLQGAGQAHA